jgi:hypothetical protein
MVGRMGTMTRGSRATGKGKGREGAGVGKVEEEGIIGLAGTKTRIRIRINKGGMGRPGKVKRCATFMRAARKSFLPSSRYMLVR